MFLTVSSHGVVGVDILGVMKYLCIETSKKNVKRAMRACEHLSRGKIQVKVDDELVDTPLFLPQDYESVYRCVKNSECFTYSITKSEEGRDFVATFQSVDASEGSAMTLDEECVGENTYSGWKIDGEKIEDYCVWVSDFVAVHPRWGKVEGNFEVGVRSSSREALIEFVTAHPPTCWNYGDI